MKINAATELLSTTSHEYTNNSEIDIIKPTTQMKQLLKCSTWLH